MSTSGLRPRSWRLWLLPLILGGCGGAGEGQRRALTEAREELGLLKEAYSAQRQRIDKLNERLALLEDQLEAQQIRRGQPSMGSAPITMNGAGAPAGGGLLSSGAAGGDAQHAGPQHLPVVPITPGAAPGGPAGYTPPVTRTRVLTQRDLDALDAELDAPPAPRQRRGEEMTARERRAQKRAERRAERQAQKKAERQRRAEERAAKKAAKKAASEPTSAVAAPAKAPRAVPLKRSVAVRAVKPTPLDPEADEGPAPQYRAAYAAFQAGNYARASVGFEGFLDRWPDHAYAEGALFWLGHCAARQGAHRKAVSTFRKMITRFPKGDHVPEALLEIGLSLKQSGRPREARETMTRLIGLYPKTDAARRATAHLDETRSGM